GRRKAAAAEAIVADHDVARQRVVVGVLELVAIGGDDDVGAAVVADVVVEDDHLPIGHDQHAGAGRDTADDSAGRGEVRGVVGLYGVVEDADGVAALLLQVGQVEHQDAAGIVLGGVVEDVGVVAVLDLDAGDVQLGGVVADNDVA